MPSGGAETGRFTSRQYLALAGEGLLAPDDKVELLEGLVVSMPPHEPTHATGIRRVERALRNALGSDALISCQLPLVAGTWSVPEPDVAVLTGRLEDYETQHPTSAHLVVEVAETSLSQDRLTKAGIYARAGVTNYWIVNLRERTVEWYSNPDRSTGMYLMMGSGAGSMRLPLDSYPEVVVTAREVLPPE